MLLIEMQYLFIAQNKISEQPYKSQCIENNKILQLEGLQHRYLLNHDSHVSQKSLIVADVQKMSWSVLILNHRGWSAIAVDTRRRFNFYKTSLQHRRRCINVIIDVETRSCVYCDESGNHLLRTNIVYKTDCQN